MIMDIAWLTIGVVYLLGITTISFLGLLIIAYHQYVVRQPDQIKFILINEKASIPQRGTQRSAGYDLKSSDECIIPARSHKAIKTGIKVILPKDTYGRIASRSGLSFKNGIEVGAGVIDEDYRNEIMVILHNHSDTDFAVEENHRIAQLIIERVIYPTTIVEDMDGSTHVIDKCIRPTRGLGGFGSTGV